MLRNIVYFFREAFKSMARNHLLSIATISTIAICILILGMSALLTMNTSNFLNNLESDVEIMAYLEQELDEEGIKSYRKKLESWSGIEKVTLYPGRGSLRDARKPWAKRRTIDLESTLGKNPLLMPLRFKAV